MGKRCNDITRLLPSFQPVVCKLLTALAERGFSPVLHETYRTPERALALSKDPDGDGPRKATGSARSIHCHGAAVDLICGDHRWDCDSDGCEFFAAIGEIAEDMGLTWGGRWTDRVDRPHVQAIPATPAAQNKLRSLKTWEAKDAFVAKLLSAREA